MAPKIEYFFGLGSPWAYIGLDAFAALAERYRAEVEPHVIPLIRENGGISSRDRPAARRAYWIEDLKRWALLRGIELRFEGRDNLSDPGPAGELIVAAWLDGQDWLALTRALQRAFWSRAEDIGAPEVRAAVAEAAGFDPAALEARLASGAVAARVRASHDLAREAGIFGLPSYRHREALFWGQDSLPFLERHLLGERLTA